MEKSEGTRSRILENSLHVFGEKGYLDATTKEIARRSSVNESTLFHHFADKPTLYREVINYYINQPVTQLTTVEKRLTFQDLQQDLYELATAYIEATFTHIDILRILMSRTINTPEISQKTFYVLPQLEEHFSSYIFHATQKGLIPESDYDIDQELFISHITRLVVDVTIFRRTYKLTKEIRETLFPLAEILSRYYAQEVFVYPRAN